MKYFFLPFLVFFSFFMTNAQEISTEIDTLYINTNTSGRFTIEQNTENKTLTKKYIDENCRKEWAKKNKKIVITESDINKVAAADKCTITPKIMGYKIQIFYTKDRNQAEKVKSEFDEKFSNLSSEIKYLQPDFKILVGDYLSKKSASRDFSRLKRMYPSSFLIQFPVRCRVAY